jgi:iron-sulfur cluster assembly accessory protein
MTVQTFDIRKEASSIVAVTETAAEYFRKQITESAAVGIRLSLKQAGCTGYKYIIEEVNAFPEDDLNITLPNGVQLFVDVAYLSAIQGTKIDMRQQGLNFNLVMQNPNVQDECGCGESFSIEE